MRVFVAETVGQIRNVASAAEARGVRAGSTLLLLCPKGNPALANRMAARAEAFDFSVRRVETPENPRRPFPATIRAHVRGVGAALRGERITELWISSGRFHLSWLASAAAAQGARIILYEDGLASYRLSDDPLLETPDIGWALRQAAAAKRAHGGAARRALAAGRVGQAARGAFALARGLGRSLVLAAAVSRAGRSAARLLAGTGSDAFFRRWTRFDEVWLSFPEAFDATGLEIAEMRRLETRPEPEAVEQARRALAALPALADRALFISGFSEPGMAVRHAVAQALAEAGVRRLAVKPHPREPQAERQQFMKALRRAGIDAKKAKQLETLDAEALVETGAFPQIFGVISASLLHAIDRRPDLDVRSVGAAALRRLQARGQAEARIQRFADDLALFDRVRDAILKAQGRDSGRRAP